MQTRKVTITGYTEQNPDFILRDVNVEVDADGKPVESSVFDVVSDVGADVAFACHCYVEAYESIGRYADGDQEHLHNGGELAIYVYSGLACQTCSDADEADGGGGVERSCGEDDCHADLHMVVVEPA